MWMEDIKSWGCRQPGLGTTGRQASAHQRAGRCGRLGPGICIRLYSEEDVLARPEFTEPEIQRTNLASVILTMTNQGLGSPLEFPFIDPPEPRAVADGARLYVDRPSFDERHFTEDALREGAVLTPPETLGELVRGDHVAVTL